MNSTSASLKGSRPRPGGVACRFEDDALAQPLQSAIANSSTAAGRKSVLILTSSRRIVFHLAAGRNCMTVGSSNSSVELRAGENPVAASEFVKDRNLLNVLEWVTSVLYGLHACPRS